MEMCSTFFIFICLPVCLGAYYLTPARFRRGRNLVLTIFSLFFYAFGEPLGVLVLLLSIWLGHLFATSIAKAVSTGRRRVAARILRIGLLTQLAILLLFQYLPSLLHMTGVLKVGSTADILVSFPIGIAFYSLQIIGIQMDAFRGEVVVEKQLLPFALTVSFFPHITRGPLVSYADFAPQIENRRESMEKFGAGVTQFTVGLAKKLLLAEPIAQVWASVQAQKASELSALGAWVGFLALAFYLYFDLSGYCDMAVGIGRMFGFELPENFYYPYRAVSYEDFWTRWNMTVTDWFRKNLGSSSGNNGSTDFGKALNFLLIGFLFGMWHGAGTNILVFGIYCGMMLALDPLILSGLFVALPEWVRRILTFIAAGIGWLFLMIPQPEQAVRFLGSMFGAGAGFYDAFGLYYLKRSFLLLFVMYLAAAPLGGRLKKRLLDETGRTGETLMLIFYGCLLILSIAALVTAPSHPFILFTD